ncbi:hypothetical protein SFRURICE_008351, partial [Spodoptera frugiperda]
PQALPVSIQGAGNMWKCAVLLSVCCLGLAAAQGLSDHVDTQPSHRPACGKNEYFDKCTFECPPEKTCANRLLHVYCADVEMPCIPKCVCKPGYYRKVAGGECIPEAECGPACGENEEYKDCRNPCIDESCDAMGSLIPNCTAPEPCEPGCACKEGYYKLRGAGDMWRCVVLLSVCCVGLVVANVNMDCGPNETFNECVDECPPEKTCDTRQVYVGCLAIVRPCYPKCVCKEGYYRKTLGGECISDEKCDLKSLEEKQAKLLTTVQTLSQQLDELRRWQHKAIENTTTLQIVSQEINDKLGSREQNVPAEITNQSQQKIEDDIVELKKTMNIIADHIRDASTLSAQAPQLEQNLQPITERLDAVSSELRTMRQLKERTPPPPAHSVCTEMALADIVKQIRPACGENEEYTECANPCIDDSCAAMGSLKPNCTESCVPGCVCKEGFFRLYEYWPCFPRCYCHELRDAPECRIGNVNTGGAGNMWRCAVLMSVCCVGLAVARGLLDDVHPDSDQNMDCGPNEYFERCFNDCAPEQTCDTRKIEQLCPAVVRPCVSKCICKEGYYRKSPGGECIPEEECDPCVNDSCEAMGSLKPNCTSPEPCEPGCVCAEGSYRLYEYLPCVPKCYCHNLKDSSESGNMWRCAVLLSVCCVGLAAAQESDVDSDLLSIFNLDCGTNEYLDQCKHECPPEKTCETRKIDINCPEELMACIPKCVCKDGYYRKTEGGECIPEEDCGAGNMWRCAVVLSVCCVGLVVGQGLVDDDNPFSFKEVVTPCIPKCVCKEGYYRKTEGGECISEEECGPACGENEEYTECANPCIDDSCAAMGSLKPNCTEPCVPGCVCKKDNFRQNEYYPCWPKCYCAEHRDSPECN